MNAINAQFYSNLVEEKLDQMDRLHLETRKALAELIFSCVGKAPMTFNDETGYPVFDDLSDGLTSVVGIRVVTEDATSHIEFNCSCDEENEYGVDDSAWFTPETYGDYDYTNLFEAIKGWMEKNQN